MADRYTFPVDASAILLFARSVGDGNPIYWDPEYARSTEVGTIIAPPTFVQSGAHWDPDWPLDLLRPGRKPRERSGGGGGNMGRGLHAEQHFEYLHPVRVGDTLTAVRRQGESWEKEGRRGGKLRFSETITEYYNQDGVLCVRARSVGVQTERAVDQS